MSSFKDESVKYEASKENELYRRSSDWSTLQGMVNFKNDLLQEISMFERSPGLCSKSIFRIIITEHEY